MSSNNFFFLISEFPEEREAVTRLLHFLGDVTERSLITNSQLARPEWTLQRLFDIAHPSSQRSLARILNRLVEKGILRRVIRVESVRRGGLGDFESLEDIPATLFDEFLGHNIEVNLDQIHTLYALASRIEA